MLDGINQRGAMMSTGQAVGYIRVSSTDQNVARQLEGVTLDKTFVEKMSGGSADNRAQLRACLEHLREGDILHVHSIDRLARNLMDLQRVVSELTGRGVGVVFHKEGLTFSGGIGDPMQTLMFQMMGAFAEFERTLIRERQREGIAAAKAAGKQLGRKPTLSPEQITEAKARRAAGESPTVLAAAYGVSRASMYSHLGGTS